MFAPLPTGFTSLEQVVEAMGQIALAAPSNLENIGVRMRKLYARARESGYQDLSRGAIRRLPYALWVKGELPLTEVEPKLVEAYWDQHVTRAIAHPRSAKRWLSPLFYTYCHWFARQQLEFNNYARNLRVCLQSAQGSFADLMRNLQVRFAWFTPNEVGARLGQLLATSRDPMSTTLERLNLWPGFLDEQLSGDAFGSVLRLPSVQLQDENVIERVLAWSRTHSGTNGSVARYPEHRVELAEAMVRPWLSRPPNDSVRNKLLSYFVGHYGDPRLVDESHKGHHWQGVSQPTLMVLRRWMVGDTLRGFVRILKMTADDIWRFRERFWMAYYDRGYIEEAWLVLGTNADWLARKEFKDMEWSKYGRLTTGGASDQSMLFLRIGHIVFMEWSHNGSLRAVFHGDPSAPEMYKREYRASDLTQVVSMDFHNNRNERPQLAHMNSEGGHWQRKARDFIYKHTGVKLNDRDIIG